MMEATQYRVGNPELPDASATGAEKARTSMDPASVMLAQDSQVSRFQHKHSRSDDEAAPDDPQSKKPKACATDSEPFSSNSKQQPGGAANSESVAEDQPLQVVQDDILSIPAATVGISDYGENDVLSGRGGGTNVHPGNRNFRDLINLHRRTYLKARKNDKPAISRAIVRSIREIKGKFLKKDEKSGLWFEIGDDAAREKTSQALRQRAPEMRKLLFDTEMEEAKLAGEPPLSPPPQQQQPPPYYSQRQYQQQAPPPANIMMGLPGMAQVNMASVATNPLAFNQAVMEMASRAGHSNAFGDFSNNSSVLMAPMFPSGGMFMPRDMPGFHHHSTNPPSNS